MRRRAGAVVGAAGTNGSPPSRSGKLLCLILQTPSRHNFCVRSVVKYWTKIRTRILIVVIRALRRQSECNLWRSLGMGDDAR
jgi:hypothetical protein